MLLKVISQASEKTRFYPVSPLEAAFSGNKNGQYAGIMNGHQSKAATYIPRRSPGVQTGASQSLSCSSLTLIRVMEQPCISSEVM